MRYGNSLFVAASSSCSTAAIPARISASNTPSWTLSPKGPDRHAGALLMVAQCVCAW
ncbi:hypothetical protein ACU686_20300 [Yinghuangia aomiensis]